MSSMSSVSSVPSALGVGARICIGLCTRMPPCVHARTHQCVCACACICACVCAHMHQCVHEHKHRCEHTRVSVCACTRQCALA